MKPGRWAIRKPSRSVCMGGILGDEKSLGRGGGVADQRQVEARLVVRLGEGPQIGRRDAALDDVDRGLAAGRA